MMELSPDQLAAAQAVAPYFGWMGIFAAWRILALASGRTTRKANQNRKDAEDCLREAGQSSISFSQVTGSNKGGPPGNDS